MWKYLVDASDGWVVQRDGASEREVYYGGSFVGGHKWGGLLMVASWGIWGVKARLLMGWGDVSGVVDLIFTYLFINNYY